MKREVEIGSRKSGRNLSPERSLYNFVTTDLDRKEQNGCTALFHSIE